VRSAVGQVAVPAGSRRSVELDERVDRILAGKRVVAGGDGAGVTITVSEMSGDG
jgi:hypothetical protein